MKWKSFLSAQDVNSTIIREGVYLEVPGHSLTAKQTVANKFVDST